MIKKTIKISIANTVKLESKLVASGNYRGKQIEQFGF
jgi:hypothetical protein